MLETEGRRLLGEKLAAKGQTQAWLARLLEVKQSSVSLWISGKNRPEPHLRVALSLLLGIPVDAWITAEESELIDRVKAFASPPKKSRKAPITKPGKPNTGAPKAPKKARHRSSSLTTSERDKAA